ncbi:probable polygalacturonase isoform X1 [Arachis hypogaea]|uniref:probable polygalacturonase isoform X1 n=1 Tax=Arachis hypogaea TaxID=3818 RepID=UPI003B2186BD
MKNDDVYMNAEDNNEPDFDDMNKRLKNIEAETANLKEILGSVAECRRLNGNEYPAINFRKHSAVLTDFGGLGDEKTFNTKAFQYAISNLSHYASDGGAQLVVPPGKWLTRSFNLIIHFTQFLQKDALILASQNGLHFLFYHLLEGEEMLLIEDLAASFLELTSLML